MMRGRYYSHFNTTMGEYKASGYDDKLRAEGAHHSSATARPETFAQHISQSVMIMISKRMAARAVGAVAACGVCASLSLPLPVSSSSCRVIWRRSCALDGRRVDREDVLGVPIESLSLSLSPFPAPLSLDRGRLLFCCSVRNS